MSIIIIVVTMMILSSCDPEAKAVSGLDVKIKVTEQFVSSGYVQYNFSTNREAYYHIGIVPVDQAPDTSNQANVKNFMTLMLDRQYADYLYWRADLLEKGTPYVADFAHHSLQYGEVEKYFNFLDPDTDYMVFAFVVDAKTNKPDGRLFTRYVHTETTSSFENNMQFEYRIQGYWNYVYPVLSTTNEIISWVPWVGDVVDSASLAAVAEFATPDAYFRYVFSSINEFEASDFVHLGIYVNKHEPDDDYDTYFQTGQTYYTGLALMDGYLSKNPITIYKFRWDGTDTRLSFKPADRLTTDW